MIQYIIYCLAIVSAFAEKINYDFYDDPIDVVIPCAKKDINLSIGF